MDKNSRFVKIAAIGLAAVIGALILMFCAALFIVIWKMIVFLLNWKVTG